MRSNPKGMSHYHGATMRTDEWLTPPEILQALPTFDLDPCSPVNRPWDTARRHLSKKDNGLFHRWDGNVWLNPPYGPRVIVAWMEKMAKHNQGIALVFARTETRFFQQFVFPVASSLFFFGKRLNFYTVAGTRSRNDGGAPSVLIAYGQHNSQAIDQAGFKGRHVSLSSQLVIVGVSPSWKCVLSIAITRLGNEASLQQLYEIVTIIAPDKTEKNRHYREKIRQTAALYFTRINKGFYSSETITVCE